MGFGIASSAGAIASSSGMFIFSEFEDKQINPMYLFAVFSLISMIVMFFMKETLNQPLADEIQEIEMQKRDEKHTEEFHSDK